MAYQITQLVIIIMAEDNASKKLSNGLPVGPILPSVIPRIVAKTTRPKIFIPGVSSLDMSHVVISSDKKKIILR